MAKADGESGGGGSCSVSGGGGGVSGGGGGVSNSVASMREEYEARRLDDSALSTADPMVLFAEWFEAATAARLPEPNAMALTTVDPRSLQPSTRVVLLKGFEDGNFTFFTNYTSRKARELDENPRAALTFLWLPLERQVRIEGSVSRLGQEASAAYFQSRPRTSQIGAWVSRQSQSIASAGDLVQRERELTARFEGKPVPIPDFWGGYALTPTMIEFWQGRRSRLHDRICFRRERGEWATERLCP